MATVLQDIGKFRKLIQRRLNLRRICWSLLLQQVPGFEVDIHRNLTSQGMNLVKR